MNTEEFINRANKIHNNKYDYSLVNYINGKTKVKIICPIHGIFEQRPSDHLFGKGCINCGGKKKLTTEEFILKANKIHNNKYDYSLVNYKNNKTKIKIICPEHGIFEQLPYIHLQGCGCKKCAGNKKYTIEEFILKSKKIHGNKYDYSLVKFNKISNKVKIICPIHGEFEQIARNHMNGSQCLKCTNNHKYTTKEFISKAKEIHGDKYDYSLVNYINGETKVKILCPKHGIFEKIPRTHTNRKEGCPICNGIIRYDNKLFIEKAKEIHGDKYDYSLINYKNYNSKIKILCPIHGIFKQTPDSHLHNKGCPSCNSSKGEKKVRKFLIENNFEFIEQKTFENCKNINLLSFDFYLPKLNICIEYDGELHFEKSRFKNANKKFKQIKNNDQIKNNYCKENDIKLIRIKYNENIKEKLNCIIN